MCDVKFADTLELLESLPFKPMIQRNLKTQGTVCQGPDFPFFMILPLLADFFILQVHVIVIIICKYHKLSADLMCAVFSSNRGEVMSLWPFTSSEFSAQWSILELRYISTDFYFYCDNQFNWKIKITVKHKKTMSKCQKHAKHKKVYNIPLPKDSEPAVLKNVNESSQIYSTSQHVVYFQC